MFNGYNSAWVDDELYNQIDFSKVPNGWSGGSIEQERNFLLRRFVNEDYMVSVGYDLDEFVVTVNDLTWINGKLLFDGERDSIDVDTPDIQSSHELREADKLALEVCYTIMDEFESGEREP